MEPKELISLVIALLMGVLTAYFAKSRGKSTLLWFFIGMFFGLFGFIALFFFPVVKPKEALLAKLPESEAPKRENRFINLSWFYADMQYTQQGPISFDELQRLWKEQKITENTYIWTQGMKEWKTISEEAELRHTLSA